MLTGGKAIHGATLGILVLDSRFPRIPGDVGNALTWPFPVQYRLVPAASPEAAVLGDPLVLAQDFIREGRALVQAGVDVVVVDTAQGHSQGVLDRVAWVKKHYPDLQVIGGNIATAAAARGSSAIALCRCFRRRSTTSRIGTGPGPRWAT